VTRFSKKLFGAAAILGLSALLLASCSRDGREMKPPTADQTESIAVATTIAESVAPVQEFTIAAPWQDGAPLDVQFTCDGSRLSPSFNLAGFPEGTVTWGLSIVDQTAANAVHWVAANIDPAITQVDAGVVPAGAVQSLNRINKVGYAAPCPKAGEPHTYILTVYALSQQLEVTDGMDAETMLTSLEAGSLGITSTSFTFTR
jgi:Raf kinase inhibitor-like YbhB/YbcL family protein